MAAHEYKVKVLHYLNPYLIWVVVDSNDCKDFVLEQVGIYGVLPLETTIDIVEEGLTTRRCEEWMPAATMLMKTMLADSIEVLFSPTHIHRKCSIFDDNIHKYGELIITRPNGNKKSLSDALLKHGFAIRDECLFYQELHSGHLKTKLNHIQTKAVILRIKKLKDDELTKSVKKNTSRYHTVEHVESALTIANVEALNKLTRQEVTVGEYLQNKFRDFELCRDIDEESVGRGFSKERKDPSPTGLKKKLAMKASSTDTLAVLEATKQFLVAHSKKKDSPRSSMVTQEAVNLEGEENSNVTLSISQSRSIDSDQLDTSKYIPVDDHISAVDDHIPAVDDESDAQQDSLQPVVRRNPGPKKKKTPYKVPDYDIKTEMRIAFGPPDINRTDLVLKVVPKDEFRQDSLNASIPSSTEDQIPIQNEDSYRNVDSDTEIDVQSALKQDVTTPEVHEKPKYENFEENAIKTDDEAKPKVTSSPVIVISPVNEGSDSKKKTNSMLQKKLRLNKAKRLQYDSLSISDTSNKDSSSSVDFVKPEQCKADHTELESDDENVTAILEKIESEYPKTNVISKKEEKTIQEVVQAKNNVNPFRNVAPDISVFVEKLVTPILMVHSKMDKRIQPTSKMRDIPFSTHIHVILKGMSVEKPMMLQSISWYSILRGYSTFMISPKGSGKTMGYLPAVCRLVSDWNTEIVSAGPICVIVCATALSVSATERLAKLLLGKNDRVFACYSGMNELDLTTRLLNGCDLLISTPSILVRLLQNTDFGVDLRRLTTFVLDDCERLSQVYSGEIKFFLYKIKEMLKYRAAKELKVQYVLASRIWCDFMEGLAKKAPNTVISIGAFQECVLYAKADMSAAFVPRENKIKSVLEFVEDADDSKKKVVVCRTDEEVVALEKALSDSKYVVYACNNTMTVQELHSLSLAWNEYQDPVYGPILVCCDANLTHLNVTDAHYLLQYSLPHLFSMFCKRFAVLNDNFPSIFKEANGKVKIKILLDDSNVEQLPKIMNFIKRCTADTPPALDSICKRVLAEKDLKKAKNLVPICGSVLALGECGDFWNCEARHALLREYDRAKPYIPTKGYVVFKILYFETAITYSARLLSVVSGDGTTFKCPETYKKITMKLAIYFAKESNRKLLGIPKVGDECAVAIKQNFFVRCQVAKILSKYNNGNPNYVLVKLIDEERFERTRDIYLYHLPEEFKNVDTYVVQIRLASIQPKDKDLFFSDLARDHLKTIIENNDDLYMKGDIAMVVGNCILVNNIEACKDLDSMNKTIVRYDFRQELEEQSLPNIEHISNLVQLYAGGGLFKKAELRDKIRTAEVSVKSDVEVGQPVKENPKPPKPIFDTEEFISVLKNVKPKETVDKVDSANSKMKILEETKPFEEEKTIDEMNDKMNIEQISNEKVTKAVRREIKLTDENWVQLGDDLTLATFGSAENPGTFFMNLIKFHGQMEPLELIIDQYCFENKEVVTQCQIGDIVLAKGANDKGQYERARIVHVKGDKVTCVYLDFGDLKVVEKKDLLPITQEIVNQLPFQAIECRMAGIKPSSEQWTEFCTSWFENRFDDASGKLKQFYVKTFAKEKAELSGSYKHVVALVDTNDEKEVIINELMIDLNLAVEDDDEYHFLSNLNFDRPSPGDGQDWDKLDEISDAIEQIYTPPEPVNRVITQEPIRSVPLVGSEDSDAESFDFNISDEFMHLFKPKPQTANLPAIKFENPVTTPPKVDATKTNISPTKVSNKSSVDSDDFTSPDVTTVNEDSDNSRTSFVHVQPKDLPRELCPDQQKGSKERSPANKLVCASKRGSKDLIVPDDLNSLPHPKLMWLQTNSEINIKIMLTGTSMHYKVFMQESHLKLYAIVDGKEYGFDIQLYGVVDENNYVHKYGRYISVHLRKILKKRWLRFQRHSVNRNIVYDYESVDSGSSDNESDVGKLDVASVASSTSSDEIAYDRYS